MTVAMTKEDLYGVLIEALTGDDLAVADADVLDAARKVRDYFEAQGIEVSRADEFEFVPAEDADGGSVAGGSGPMKVGAYPVDRNGERLYRRVRRA